MSSAPGVTNPTTQQSNDALGRDETLTAAYAILMELWRSDSIRARADDSPLTFADAALVGLISRQPGCLAIDLARSLKLNRSTVSRQISGLAAAGVIEVGAEERGAAQPLHVTDEGRAALRVTLDKQRARFARRTSTWTDEEVTTFFTLLLRLGEAAADDED